MTLLNLLWAAFVGLGILAVIGAPLAWAVGLRGFWIVAAAAPFAITIIGGTAVVAAWVGLPWSLLPVMLMTLVVGGAIYLIRRRVSPRTSPSVKGRVDGWLIVSLVAAGLIIALRVVQIIGAPDHISQTFDNIFHLNGVRFVLNEGNASSLHLGSMTSPRGTLPFYPAGWHALTSLVVQLSGATIPVAVNAVTLVVSAVVWPVSAVLLTRTLFGGHPAVTVAAALLSASVPAFPILLMDYGVLYPLQLGLSLTPVALAATFHLLGLGDSRQPKEWGWWALVLVGVIPGVTIAHPGAFVAWLALSVPMAGLFAWRWFSRARTPGRKVIVVGAVVAYLVAGVMLVRILRPPLEARLWPTQMSVLDAIGQMLAVSAWYLVPAVVVGSAILLGIVWAVIDHTRASLLALAMYVIGVGLFVVVASLPFPQVRDALTGSWYNNLPRLAALSVLPMIPVGAYGVARTWQTILALPPLRRGVASLPPTARGVLTAVVATALALLLQGPAMQRAVDWAWPQYRLDANSPLLTSDEHALLERVDEHVPEGVAIAGSAWTGTSLAYAIANRPVLMPHTLMDVSDPIAAVNDGLDSAQSGDAVCRALADLDVGFVLDFGSQEVHPGKHDFPGLDELARSEAVRLVDSEGAARLYEIVACG